MSANVAVIYSGADVREVAEAFGQAAHQLSANVRLLRVPGDDTGPDHPDATFADLEWADGIAFGTPVAPGHPSPALVSFIEATEPLWRSAALFDAHPRPEDPDDTATLSGPRLRTAQYRGRRLTALAAVLAAERSRRARLEL